MRKPFLIALIVIFVLAAGGMAYIYRDLWMKKPQQITTFIQKDTISLYIPKGQGKLAEKRIDIQSNMGDREKGDTILRNLKNLNVIPETVVLNDFAMDSDGIIYLNFSKTFGEGKISAIGEILRTFSIVNTFLANFRNTKGVLLLTEGQPVYTPGGAIYAYKPLEFNQDLLED